MMLDQNLCLKVSVVMLLLDAAEKCGIQKSNTKLIH